MTTTKTPRHQALILAGSLFAAAALFAGLSAEAQTIAGTNALPTLPAPVQAVLDYIPSIRLTDTNLMAATVELRIGTTTGASPADTGVFSDVQCSWNFKTNFVVTGEVISGNIGGAIESFNGSVGYRKVLGNFEIEPHLGVGYLLHDKAVAIPAGLLLEVQPIQNNPLGIYTDVSYVFLLDGRSTGQIKGGVSYSF